MTKKFFAAALILALCMAILPAATTGNPSTNNAAIAEAANLTADQPEYKIEVNGTKGTVTRLNNTSVFYDDMYIRYAVSYNISGEPYMMIDLIDVKWSDAQDGTAGTFSIPKLQITGTITCQSFTITTDESANQKPINEVVPNAYGFLVK